MSCSRPTSAAVTGGPRWSAICTRAAIGGDAIMLVMIVALFAGVLRGRTQLDAGRWLETARADRFDALAASGSGEGGSSVEGATSVEALAVGATDSDDARLAAYNAYLARLENGGGHRTGSPL